MRLPVRQRKGRAISFHSTTHHPPHPAQHRHPARITRSSQTRARERAQAPLQPPRSNATDGGGGTPINITDPTKIASQAGDTLSKALGGVTSGVAADTASIEGAGTSWLNSIFGEGTDLLARGGFILLGLFLLLGAFVFFYIDSKGSGGPNVEVVPVPV